MTPFDLQTELDRLMPVLSHEEQLCALWRRLDARLRAVSKCQQLDDRALVIIVTEKMKRLHAESEDYLEEWLDKHRNAIIDRAEDQAFRLVKNEDLKFSTKTLLLVWLANSKRIRSRDLTPYFNELEINSSNLSKTLDDLVIDGLLKEELEPKKGTEKEFTLTKTGNDKLKRLMNDPPN